MEPRVAIVTGASRGIGREIARRLAREGRIVALVARNAGSLDAVRSLIEEDGGHASVNPCDVGDSQRLAEIVEKTASEYGRLDILVNNAGMTRDGLLLRMTDEDFDEVVRVNLRSSFVACRAAARPMMRGRFGRNVNIGSVSGLMGNAGQVNYAAAKAGLVGLTKSIAKELGSKGITANVLAPGFVETDMTADLPKALKEEVRRNLPVRRFGTAEEIAHAACFLASDEAGYITGQVLVVDGGMDM
jgi:3-oxoacyl-[acyl-carrier protein] reductase